MGCGASVHVSASNNIDLAKITNNENMIKPSTSSGIVKPDNSSKFDGQSTASDSLKNQNNSTDAFDNFGRQGNVYRRRSRVSLSKIDIHDLLTETKESPLVESADLFLTIVSATYDDFDCSDELQSLVTGVGELKLVGGAHSSLLSKKPHYHKPFDLTYCYQTEIIELNRRLDEIEYQGMIVDAPGSHLLMIAKATLNEIDITDKMRSLVVEEKMFAIAPFSRRFRDLCAEELQPQTSTEDQPVISDMDRVVEISYYFQTPHFSLTCHGNEDIFIPNYDAVLASQEPVPALNLENPAVMKRVMSSGHLVTVKRRHDSNGSETQHFPLSGRNRAESVIKAVPPMMKGYINKESGSKVWMNRYFVLDSTDKLAHLTYYKRSSSQFPYGKELRGELALMDYTLLVDKDIIILRSRSRPDEGVVLEIKEEAIKDCWIRAIENHLAYAEYETLKAVRRGSGIE